MQKALEVFCYVRVCTPVGWLYVDLCPPACVYCEAVRGGGVRTCPRTGRGSCRAAAQTAACGRSCGEPSWCYAVAGGDWTVASVLWHPSAQINIKTHDKWTKPTNDGKKKHKKAKSMVQTLKRRGNDVWRLKFKIVSFTDVKCFSHPSPFK